MTEEKHWTSVSDEVFIDNLLSICIDDIELFLSDNHINIEKISEDMGLDKEEIIDCLSCFEDRETSIDFIVKLSRIIGLKVAIIVYNDKDHENMLGPIYPEIFRRCWDKCGRPRTIFDFE